MALLPFGDKRHTRQIIWQWMLNWRKRKVIIFNLCLVLCVLTSLQVQPCDWGLRNTKVQSVNVYTCWVTQDSLLLRPLRFWSGPHKLEQTNIRLSDPACFLNTFFTAVSLFRSRANMFRTVLQGFLCWRAQLTGSHPSARTEYKAFPPHSSEPPLQASLLPQRAAHPTDLISPSLFRKYIVRLPSETRPGSQNGYLLLCCPSSLECPYVNIWGPQCVGNSNNKTKLIC